MPKITLLLFLLFFALTPQSISAHVLESDNTVGAVMHIEPNDNPPSQQEVSIIFDFKDTENIFSIEECRCNVTISQDQNILTEQPITQLEPSVGSVLFTFPKEGEYKITVQGEPKEEAVFTEFSLEYTAQASIPSNPTPISTTNSKTKPTSTTNNFLPLATGATILILAAGFMIYRKYAQK